MTSYKKANTADEIIELAKVALKHRLYVKDWQLRDALDNIINCNKQCTGISIAYIDGKPIGVCAMIPEFGLNAEPSSMTFVRKQYRRQGIGTQLIEQALTDTPAKQFFWYKGAEGSEQFFERLSMATPG